MSQHANSSSGPHQRTSVFVAYAAIGLSLFATAIVVGNVAAAVPPQPDEDAWAHLFQLAMVAQFPLFLMFIATADWKRCRRALFLLATQLCAAAAAFAALWWSGY